MLNDSTVSNLITIKWIEVSDWSDGQYPVNKNISLKNHLIRLVLCDYSGAYISVKGTITAESTNGVKKRIKKQIFRNNALLRSCISKINNTFLDNSEDLVMPIRNLLEYTDSYFMTSRSLWNCYIDAVKWCC